MSDETVSREQLIADLGFLNETAMEFLRLTRASGLYQAIVERLSCSTGDSWVSLSTFDAEHQTMHLRALAGPRDMRGRLLALLGEAPIGRARAVNDEALRHLLSGRLHKVPGGLHEVLFARVSRRITRVVEELAGIGEIHAMGCVSQGALLGSVVIALRGSQPQPRFQVVEAFLNQAAVALQREQAEERLRMREVECRTLFDHIPDLLVVLDEAGAIRDINRKGCEEMGHVRENLLGRSFADVFEPPECAESLPWNDVLASGSALCQRSLRRSDGICRRYRLRVNQLPDGRMLIAAVTADGEPLQPCAKP